MTARSRPTRALRLAQLVAGLNVMVVLAGTVMILALQGRPDVGGAQLNALVYSLLGVVQETVQPEHLSLWLPQHEGWER